MAEQYVSLGWHIPALSGGSISQGISGIGVEGYLDSHTCPLRIVLSVSPTAGGYGTTGE
jgi:hypothetical protein